MFSRTLARTFARNIPLSFALALLATGGVRAASLTVTNLGDSGPGSLRAQIAAASSGDTIDFQSGLQGTITLSSQLSLNKNLIVSGPAAAGAIVVSGGNATRVFSIDTGVAATIQNLTISNGLAVAVGGGGILNDGNLTLSNVSLTANSAASFLGGAVLNRAVLSLINVTASGNNAGRGGGLYSSGSSMSLTDSRINTGVAGSEGGGIFAASGTVSLLRSSVTGGDASSSGGGLSVDGATVSVRQSTLAGNRASSSGGGFALTGAGTLTIANSTVSGNTSNSQGGGGFSSGGTLTLINVTITDNRALGFGGGIATNGTVNATNTLIAGNTAANGATANLSGTLSTNTNNLIGGSVAIGALAANGFSTQTHALLPGSSAIGAGNAPACSAAPVSGIDQRGKSRPGSCSVGAYEPQLPFVVAATGGNGQSAQINTAFAALLQATLSEADGRVVPVAGTAITFTLPASGASGTFSGGGSSASVNTNVNGIATSPTLTANAIAGAWSAAVSAAGFSTGAFNLSNTGGGGAPTTTTLTSSPNPSALGQSVSFTATVTGNSPSGTVQFREGAAVLGSASLNGSGQASFSTSSLGAGDHSIVAAYLGNASNNASSSAPLVQSVGKTAQTITFNALPPRTFGDPPFIVNATASSGLTVSFATQTPAACSVSGNTVTIVAIGACTIRASQPGNASFAAATPVDQSFVISGSSQTPQTITFPALPQRTFKDPAFTISASASSGLPVLFTPQTPTVCTVSIDSVIILAAGTCTIRAEQSGSVTFAPALPVDQTFLVNKLAQTITFANLPDRTYGDPSFSLNASTDSTLDVDYSGQTPSVCAVSVGGRVTLLGGGTCTIRAGQPGDANHLAAADVERSFAIIVPPGVVTLTYTPQNPIAGEQITFRLGVGGTNPSGTLELFDGSQSLGTVTVNAGQATFSTSKLAVGNHLIKVRYSGDGVNPASESPGFGLAVIPTGVSSGGGGGGGGCAMNPHGAPETVPLLLLAAAGLYRARKLRRVRSFASSRPGTERF